MDKAQIIYKAKEEELNIVKSICDNTINAIYPKYYPKGAVDAFIKYHSIDKIKEDITNGNVYVYKIDGIILGTISFKDNHIYRLFVEPKNQKKGIGKQLIIYAEWMIFKKYDSIELDASLPSKSMYLKNGYKEIEYNKMETDNGDYLCYDVMRKEKLK